MNTPLMYKGFIIVNDNNKFGAYNFNGVILNTIYENYESLKIIIDNI